MLNTWVLMILCRLVEAPGWCSWLLAIQFILQCIGLGIKIADKAKRD